MILHAQLCGNPTVLIFYLNVLFFTDDRNLILLTRLCRNLNKYTVQNLMNIVNKKKLVKLFNFISNILYHVQNPSDLLSLFLFYIFPLFFPNFVFVNVNSYSTTIYRNSGTSNLFSSYHNSVYICWVE